MMFLPTNKKVLALCGALAVCCAAPQAALAVEEPDMAALQAKITTGEGFPLFDEGCGSVRHFVWDATSLLLKSWGTPEMAGNPTIWQVTGADQKEFRVFFYKCGW